MSDDPQFPKHDDPAVNALIQDGWLGHWDSPITVGDLENAVALVRRSDLHHAGTPARIEWAMALTYLTGETKHSAAGDEEHAALMADSVATHLASLNEPTREHNGVDSAAVVNREVRVLHDGTQIIGPWRHVRAGRPIEDREDVA